MKKQKIEKLRGLMRNSVSSDLSHDGHCNIFAGKCNASNGDCTRIAEFIYWPDADLYVEAINALPELLKAWGRSVELERFVRELHRTAQRRDYSTVHSSLSAICSIINEEITEKGSEHEQGKD